MSPPARVLLTVPMLPPRVLGPAAARADFLEADAVVSKDAPGGPWELARARVEGGRIDGAWVVMGERRPDGLPFEDVWVTSDGSRAHFRVRPPEGLIAPGRPGIVRVVFASARDGTELEATARFTTGPDRTLVLPNGVSTSVEGFYTGPGPGRELVVGADPAVHIGLRSWDDEAYPQGLRSTWRQLELDTWLDASVRGTPATPPSIRVPPLRAHVTHSDQRSDARYAHVEIDPRNSSGRLQTGRHRMEITWATRGGRGPRAHAADACVVVADDGTIAVEPC